MVLVALVSPPLLLLLLLSAGGAAAAVDAPGCYVDDATVGGVPHRLMLFSAFKNMDPIISVDTCDAACAAHNFTLAGLEAGHGCFCSDALAPPVQPPRPTIECCTPCIGNSSQVCGGVFRLLVFKVGEPPLAPPATCPQFQPVVDPRHIRLGVKMLEQGYLDQPYCVCENGLF